MSLLSGTVEGLVLAGTTITICEITTGCEDVENETVRIVFFFQFDGDVLSNISCGKRLSKFTSTYPATAGMRFCLHRGGAAILWSDVSFSPSLPPADRHPALPNV
jgi:hypothetical protein